LVGFRPRPLDSPRVLCLPQWNCPWREVPHSAIFQQPFSWQKKGIFDYARVFDLQEGENTGPDPRKTRGRLVAKRDRSAFFSAHKYITSNMVLGLKSNTQITLISVILLLAPLIGIHFAQQMAQKRQGQGGIWSAAEPYLSQAVRWMPLWYIAHVVFVFLAVRHFTAGIRGAPGALDTDAYGPLSSEPWVDAD
jgi:hypothetical protein